MLVIDDGDACSITGVPSPYDYVTEIPISTVCTVISPIDLLIIQFFNVFQMTIWLVLLIFDWSHLSTETTAPSNRRLDSTCRNGVACGCQMFAMSALVVEAIPYA